MVLLPALKPACTSAKISSLLVDGVFKDCLQHDRTRMADKAYGSAALAQLPNFGNVITRDCPCCRPFSCLPNLDAD